MNRLLVRITVGLFISLLTVMVVIFFLISNYYGRIFTDPTWPPIYNSITLIQYILDNTPPELMCQECRDLSSTLNRRIEILSSEEAAAPKKILNRFPEDSLIYAKSDDGKKMFYARVHNGIYTVLIDPAFQLYKPVINPPVLLISCLAVTIVTTCMAFWLAFPLTRRLKKLETAAKRIRQGDVAARIDILSRDLIGNVSRCFNQMAEQIESLIETRQRIPSTVVQKFQIPIARIQSHLKRIHSEQNISGIKLRLGKIDRSIDEMERLANDILTHENHGSAGGLRHSKRTIVEEAGPNPRIGEVSFFKTGVMKFILRMSFGILLLLLLRHLIMTATPLVVYRYVEYDPDWYPVYTTAELVRRAVDRTPSDLLSSRLEALQVRLNRRIDLLPIQSMHLFARTHQQEFFDNMVYGLYGGRSVFCAPVQGGAHLLIIEPASSSFLHYKPSLLFNVLAVAVIFVVTAIFSIILSMPIVRNLKKLESGIIRIRQEDLNSRVDIPLNKPIGSLARCFNDMADRIQSLLANQKHLFQSVIHEILTPVSRIRFHLEVLSGAQEKSVIYKRASEIETEVQELNLLLDELSTLTKLDNIKEKLRFDNIPLGMVLGEITKYHRETYVHKNIILPQSDGQDVNVRAHPVYFKRAIHNLLSNAIRHAENTVSVCWKVVHGGISIDISDDGPGIPKHARKSVLEPFTRLDRSRSRDSGGFGLGLAIVTQIVNLHSGNMSISDNSPQGTLITTFWPAGSIQ